jgi:hypothetical protein
MVRYRLGAGLAVALAVLSGFLAFAPDAFAHWPAITGLTWCGTNSDFTINFNAHSWDPTNTNHAGENPHIDVGYQLRTGDSGTPSAITWLTWKPTWEFTPANNLQFSDAFPLNTDPSQQIQLVTKAGAPWGDGQPADPQFWTTTSGWLTLPDFCQPVTTSTTTTTTTTTTTLPTTTTTQVSPTSAVNTTTTTRPTTTTTQVLAVSTVPTTAPVGVAGEEVTNTGTLPATGSEISSMVVVALALLAIGVCLELAARRGPRRQD